MDNGTRSGNSKLCLVFDCWSRKEENSRRLFGDDRARLLKYLLARLSIPDSRWFNTYVWAGPKREIPTHKKKREEFLKERFDDLTKQLLDEGKCEVIGFGTLPCEFFTNHVHVTTRAGTCWKPTVRWQDSDLKLTRVWIARSPDAALFDPSLTVDIYGVLRAAVKAAGIVTVTKFADELPVFDWSEYI